MSRYAAVPWPVERAAAPDVGAISAGIAEWATSAPMRDLVSGFGGSPPVGSTGEILSYLDEFSSEVWDFRRGMERHEARIVHFDQPMTRLIHQASDALGLAGRARPAGDRYSHLRILGGGVRTCVVRAAYAAGLVAAGVIVQTAAGLGSFRPTTNDERRDARRLGWPVCLTEFVAMDLGMRRAFGQSAVPAVDERGEHWRVRRYPAAGSAPALAVLAAPSSEPARRRANTADTLVFWGDTVAGLSPQDTVLVVTSNVHAPFQHFDAVRTLGLRFGCGVDTVGMDAMSADEEWLRFTWSTDKVLQEVRSAIRSLVGLFAEVRSASTAR